MSSSRSHAGQSCTLQLLFVPILPLFSLPVTDASICTLLLPRSLHPGSGYAMQTYQDKLLHVFLFSDMCLRCLPRRSTNEFFYTNYRMYVNSCNPI